MSDTPEENGVRINSMTEYDTDYNFEKTLDAFLAFNIETNYDKLLEIVLSKMIAVTASKGGSLFTPEDDMLHLHTSKNTQFNSAQAMGEFFGLPPIACDNTENIIAYAVANDEIVTVEDVYADSEFDFSEIKKFDELVGNKTCAVSVFPLTASLDGQNRSVGAIQLIDAKDGDIDACALHRKFCSCPKIRLFLKMAAHAMANLYVAQERDASIKELHLIADIHLIAAAEEKSRAKSRFLARMSHEIRTPLNSILGITEIQLRQTKHSNTTLEAFQRIYNSSTLLLELINNLLDLSKAESDKLDLDERPYDLANLISDVVQLNTIHTLNRHIQFKLNVDSSLPSVIVGDSLRVKQILNNIISNAFKYTDDGMIELSFLREPIALAPQNYAVDSSDGSAGEFGLSISIKDTGRGMTEEQVNRLFAEEYIRFDERSYIQGTGLGMAITHKLIVAMNGKVDVRSTPGAGTCVSVLLPQRSSGEEIIGEVLSKDLENFEARSIGKKMPWFIFEPMPYGSVLVVDDQETNLYVAKGLFLPYQIKFDVAYSGQEAVDKVLAGNVYDIIFMDHMMPSMDGIETVGLLRKMGYEHPIVALTANAIIGQDEVFMQNGFDDYLSKPIDTRVLDACLNRFIREKQSLEVIAAVYDSYEKTQSMQKWEALPMEHFLRDADKVITALDAFMIKQSFDAGNLKTYILSIHSMKNLLVSIGEENLASVANILEKAGRNSEEAIIIAETPALLQCFKGVVAALKESAEKSGKNQDDEGVEDLDFLKTQLAAIQAACEGYDKRSAEDAMGALEEKTCSRQTKRFLSDLSLFLLRGDYEEGAELAKQTGLLL
ncbi:MAG: ATP-binding protein [Oscillospiraceae bacterium]|nr:ATP-binding protein [Oscillospiraceae bacterium]